MAERISAEEAVRSLTRAVRQRATAEAVLVEAMHAADRAGVARNEICRQVKDAYSRQKALDLLNASVLLDRAVEALAATGFRIGGRQGQVVVERRRSRVMLRVLGADGSDSALRRALEAQRALAGAGLALHAGGSPAEELSRGATAEVRDCETR